MRSPMVLRGLQALGLIIVGIAAMNPAFAGDDATRSIRVQGTGGVDARPDQAVILAAVVDQQAHAGAALEANAKEMRRVLLKLGEFAVAEADIQTRNFSVTPIFERRQSGTSTPARFIATRATRRKWVCASSPSKTTRTAGGAPWSSVGRWEA